ncbi:MAG: hypothetical protein DRG31_02340, partial [Deltaproteobacteria bacterium]
SRNLKNVTASRSIVSDFFDSPFWGNIPDKPFEALGSEFTTDAEGNLTVNQISFDKIVDRTLSRITVDTDLDMAGYKILGVNSLSFVKASDAEQILLEALDADDTNTLRNSPIISIIGKYWDSANAVSVNRTARVLHRMIDTTPKSELVFQIEGSDYLRVGDDGVISSKLLRAPEFQSGDWSFREDIIDSTSYLRFYYKGTLKMILSEVSNLLVYGDIETGSGNLKCNGETKINIFGDTIYLYKDTLPPGDATLNLGSAKNRWKNIYFGGSAVADSDDATDTTTTVDSPPYILRGAYWDSANAVSVDRELDLQLKMIAEDDYRFVIHDPQQGVDLLEIDKAGVLKIYGNTIKDTSDVARIIYTDPNRVQIRYYLDVYGGKILWRGGDVALFDDTTWQFIVHVKPNADASYDLGASDRRWNNIHCVTLYTGDIKLKYGWRLFEKEDGIYLEKDGKVYRIKIEEVE